MKIFYKKTLASFDQFPLLIEKIENAFREYSEGEMIVPPVGHIPFLDPQGDVHIKCAARKRGSFYAVKIASHFPSNPGLGMNAIQGVILLCDQKTGLPVAFFQDEGYLTQVRTGIAGAIFARYLASPKMAPIGIIGSGAQARFQLYFLKFVHPCREVFIWSRNPLGMKQLKNDPSLKDFNIHLASSPQEVAKQCRIIVTTTPSETPILSASDILPGTHITAVGADRLGKQELDAALFQIAQRIVCDSKSQCIHQGELQTAFKKGILLEENIIEIGEIIGGKKQGRTDEEEITIADLTGIGVQDLAIAETYYEHFRGVDKNITNPSFPVLDRNNH